MLPSAKDFWIRDSAGRTGWDLAAAQHCAGTGLRPARRGDEALEHFEGEAPPQPPVTGDMESEEEDIGGEAMSPEEATDMEGDQSVGERDVRPSFTGTSTWYSRLPPEVKR